MGETKHFRGWDGDCTLHREVDRLNKESEGEGEEKKRPVATVLQQSATKDPHFAQRVSKESNLDSTLNKRQKPRRLALPQ